MTAVEFDWNALWRKLGAKRRGKKGWMIESPRRGPFWMIDVGPVDGYPGGVFWRVGLIDRQTESGIPIESTHLRYPDQAEALEAVTWLAAVAKENAATWT